MSVGGVVLNGPLLAAVPIALAAGALSFFSPCCLPLVPGYLSYVTGVAASTEVGAGAAVGAAGNSSASARPTTGLARYRAVTGAGLFVLGFSVIFVLYGAAFGAVGSWLLEYQKPVTRVLGAFTILFGLWFLGALNGVPGAGRTVRAPYRPRSGLAGAPVLGAMFAIGWTPCIGPTLAAVLTLSATTGGAARGGILAFVYSLGLGIPFVVTAFAMQRAMHLVSFMRAHARGVMRTGGVMLIAVGVLEVSGLWTAWMAALKSTISGTVLPL